MVSQRLVDIVGEMEPDSTGGPLRPEVGVFLFGVLRLSWSGVRWAKGDKFTRGRANDYSVFLEYHSVDGGNERRALHVMFELVAAALGGASKFAASNLRLGSSSRDPGVAPGAEHAGSNSRGGGFGEVDVFFELVVEYLLISFCWIYWRSRRIY